MSDIRFPCPYCKQSLEAPPEMAGEAVECPSCGREMKIPQQEPSPPSDTEDAPAASGVCPECGAAMEKEAVLCLQCGFHIKLGRKLETELD